VEGWGKTGEGLGATRLLLVLQNFGQDSFNLNLDFYDDEEFYYGDKLTSRNFGLLPQPKERIKKAPKQPKPKKRPVVKKKPDALPVYCICRTTDES
jgi:hypothetical protein